MMREAASYPVLRQAWAVQDTVRDIITERVRGRDLSESRVTGWMEARRELVNSEATTGLDALALAHTLLQAIGTVPRVADEPETVEYLTEEMTAAASGLIRFLEEGVGRTRDEVGLFDNFIGPRRQ